MFKLEHGTEDIDKAKKAAPILVKLHDAQDAKWNDDFSANSLLRQQLRVSLKLNYYTFLILYFRLILIQIFNRCNILRHFNELNKKPFLMYKKINTNNAIVANFYMKKLCYLILIFIV